MANVPGENIEFQIIGTSSPMSFYWACENHPSVKYSKSGSLLNRMIRISHRNIENKRWKVYVSYAFKQLKNLD